MTEEKGQVVSGLSIISMYDKAWKCCVFTDTKFEEIEMCRFENCTFERCSFDKGTIRRSYFCNCIFDRCDLKETKIEVSTLLTCRFKHSKMSRASLDRVTLVGVNIYATPLDGSSWNAVNVEVTTILNSSIKGAVNVPVDVLNPALAFKTPGTHQAFKMVKFDTQGRWISPFSETPLIYAVGKTVSAKLDLDEQRPCSEGISLITLQSGLTSMARSWTLLEVQFKVKDPNKDICVPPTTSGSFRVKSCKVLREVPREELFESF